MATERVTVACTNPRGARGMAGEMKREGWVPTAAGWHEIEHLLYLVELERQARALLPMAVRSVAEQAAALGLPRVVGAADVIYSGTFLEAEDDRLGVQ